LESNFQACDYPTLHPSQQQNVDSISKPTNSEGSEWTLGEKRVKIRCKLRLHNPLNFQKSAEGRIPMDLKKDIVPNPLKSEM